MSVVDKIHHYQRNIEKGGDDLDRMFHCITKLYNLPVTVQHLQETGVGRTVNGLRKYDGTVGDAAKALVAKWKAMVADEYTSGEDEDETETYVTTENHTDSHDSPKLEEIEQNVLPEELHESKHKYKGNKNEMSAEHNAKHLSKSKNVDDKHKKHDKSSHSSKHSQDEAKSKDSKSNKSSSRKDEAHSSKEHNHNRNCDIQRINDKTSKSNDNDNKKRFSENSKRENKKSKLDGGNNNEVPQLSASQKNNTSSRCTEIKIKVETDKDKPTIKQEKTNLQEESRSSSSSSSSKNKSQESSSKGKDGSEKDKYKKEHKKDSGHHSSKMSDDLNVAKKNHNKSKDKDKKKDHKDKGKHEKEKKKMLLSQEITSNEGIDCNSGASFAEALGMCTMPQPSKKRSHNSSNISSRKVIKTEPMSPPHKKKKMVTLKTEQEYNDDPNPPSLLAPNVKLEPLNVDLASTLPEISPNYKPLPHINPVQRKEEVKLSVNDVILVKNQRTKVYSGNKVGYTSVPSLYELSMRVLIENIDALEFTGGVPYDIIKPVLERATPDQLYTLEHYNPYLIEDTGTLWQFHCNREFRNKQRQEMESWREMYMRCLDEREAKLKTLTANIKQSIDKSVPVRSTKLAYVDNVVKPPRNILKKQAKYGTANATPATVSNIKKKLVGGGGVTNNATNIAVPPPPMSRFKTSTSSNVKKTKAPLMAKALQFIKGRYKR